MREVAAAAEVAISSVSRVLSGHPDVSPEMRDRVMDAVARLDYERDFLAQSLRRGQTLSIGFVLGDIANPVMADLMLGTEADLRQAGYTILLALNPDGRPGVDAERIRLLLSRRVDGLIVSSASEDAKAMPTAPPTRMPTNPAIASATPRLETVMRSAGSSECRVQRRIPGSSAASPTAMTATPAAAIHRPGAMAPDPPLRSQASISRFAAR